MENIMDKLAQRWNAQEIIKANTAAEAEEKAQLQNQLKECQEYLAKIQAQTSNLEELLTERIENLSETAVRHMNEASSENMARLESWKLDMEALQTDLGVLKELQASLEGMQGLPAQLEDFVHKENVRVYRNVQAVVTDETSKQTESLQESIYKLKGRLSVVLGISVAALLAAAGGLIFQLLTYLQIL